MNDRQIGSGEEEEVAGSHRINHHCLQLNQVLSDQVFPVLSHVWVEARLPIDLLFPTCRTQMLTCTIDEYVASLYDRLRDSLVIARDCAIKEAQRQKRLYNRKVGAIGLRPGDHVLVCLDAFRGQRRKLKNWWGDDLHMVVTHMADGIPAYVVKNNHTVKKKVVHQAQLLLWLADYGEPVRCNLIDISNVPPGTVMDQYPQGGCEDDNPVPGCSLQLTAWT